MVEMTPEAARRVTVSLVQALQSNGPLLDLAAADLLALVGMFVLLSLPAGLDGGQVPAALLKEGYGSVVRLTTWAYQLGCQDVFYFLCDARDLLADRLQGRQVS